MNRPSKSICFVNPLTLFGTVGGAEVQIYYLAAEALKRNWSVSYVTQPEQIPKQIPEELRRDFRFIPFDQSGDEKKDLAGMSQVLTSIDADLYYQRGRKLWTWFTGEFARKSGKPLIYAASMDLDCKKHKFVFRRTGGLKAVYKNISRMSGDRKLDKLTLQGIHQASQILAQTEQQKTGFKKNLGLESFLFPNIHPVPESASIVKSSPPVVLWLATVKAWKQPEVFIRAAENLQHLSCRFILAGQLSDSRLIDPIRKAEASLNNFEYHPDISFEESNRLIGRASLFVNTSRNEEGFPNTYIQAWLRQTPTLTLRFDPDEVIQKHRLGEHCGSVRRLEKAIESYIESPQKRQEAGKRARHYAIEHHGLEKKAEDFFELAARLTASPSRPSVH